MRLKCVENKDISNENTFRKKWSYSWRFQNMIVLCLIIMGISIVEAGNVLSEKLNMAKV